MKRKYLLKKFTFSIRTRRPSLLLKKELEKERKTYKCTYSCSKWSINLYTDPHCRTYVLLEQVAHNKYFYTTFSQDVNAFLIALM